MPKALKRIISLIFVVIIFYFIGRVTYKEWDKFYGYNWSPNPPLLISSIIILLIAYILFSHGWTLILRMIGVKIEWRKGLSICLLSIFGRYIPGGIWTVLGKVYLCRLEGIPDSRSSMSILLDQSYTVVSAGIIFTLILHSLSVILIGESLSLDYSRLPFLNSTISTLIIFFIIFLLQIIN